MVEHVQNIIISLMMTKTFYENVIEKSCKISSRSADIPRSVIRRFIHMRKCVRALDEMPNKNICLRNEPHAFK